MKSYLKTDPHGFNGDFYKCGDDTFRADNLHVATQIAFNNWLHNFDALYRSSQLVSLQPGAFTVRIDHHADSGTTVSSETETHTVEYHGPADMFEAHTLASRAAEPIQGYIEVMRRAAAAGHPAVRLSRGASNGSNAGMPVFNCRFPRWRDNGEWWPSDCHLAYDNESLATEQMKFAGLI